MSENEFSALIKQLCNKFCSSPTSNNRPLSNNSSRDCRRLYKKAFRVYFGCVGGPFQIDERLVMHLCGKQMTVNKLAVM